MEDIKGETCVCDMRNGDRTMSLPSVGSPREKLLNGKREEENDETVSLLPPPGKGGLSRKPEKPPRKVQWNDRNGNSLVEVLEYQPSNESDSDEDESESCLCIIM